MHTFTVLFCSREREFQQKMEKQFTLIIVRHGEAMHNIAPSSLTDSDFKFTENLKIMDGNLTKKGQKQAEFVADRLKDYKFDLAVTSDMKRTMKTAEAIMKKMVPSEL